MRRLTLRPGEVRRMLAQGLAALIGPRCLIDVVDAGDNAHEAKLSSHCETLDSRRTGILLLRRVGESVLGP